MLVSMTKKQFYKILLLLIFMFCGVISVYSQNPQLGNQTLLQQLLNYLPAIPIAGKNLKFQFGGDTWIATLNGKNLLTGNLTLHSVDERSILILKQTHTYVVSKWVKTPGADIILEYKEGPPASLRAISRSDLPEELAKALDDTNINTDVATSSVSAPSQDSQSAQKQGSILAIFGFGGQYLDIDREEYWIYKAKDETEMVTKNKTLKDGTTVGVNILFIGNSGFTISIGIDTIFKINGVDADVNTDPILGFGYINKKLFYIGGLLNFIPKPYFFDKIKVNKPFHDYDWAWADVFITPTLVFGYDFGNFLLGGQLSYMRGAALRTNGFKFSLGTGVSLW